MSDTLNAGQSLTVGQELRSNNFAQGLDIYQSDGANFIDLRAQTIRFIKEAEGIAPEIKALLNLLN